MSAIAKPIVTFNLAGAEVTIREADIIDLWKERARMRPGAEPPRLRIGDQNAAGETFMGVVRNEDGIEYRVWDLGEADSEMKHEPALAWAKERGGDLPTRREQSLLFANRAKGQFKEAWYWSKEQFAGVESCAWVQSFDDGGQSDDRKSDDCRARAVRREPIQ